MVAISAEPELEVVPTTTYPRGTEGSRMTEGEIAAAGSRREARERVLGILYEADVKGQDLASLVDERPVPLDGYAAELMDGLGVSVDDIDLRIDGTSHHWKLSRMPVVDRCVLRLGAFELLYRDDIPSGVAINEAVELAAEYSTAESSRFVNGILSRLSELAGDADPPDEA